MIKLKVLDRMAEFNYSVPLETPIKLALSEEDITECLTSLGNTFFECVKLNIQKDDDFFVPKSALKQLKRDFISDFSAYLASSFKREGALVATSNLFKDCKPIDTKNASTIIMCGINETKDYARFADFLVVKPNDYNELYEKILSKSFVVDKEKHILDLPAVAFDEDINLLQKIIDTNVFDKFMVNNIYGIELAKDYQIMLGYKMNILNNETGLSVVKSIEAPVDAVLNKDKQNEFCYCFGRSDIMQYVHCYYAMERGCDRCKDSSSLTLIDDRGERYEIKRQKAANCFNLLISSAPENLTRHEISKRFIDAASITSEEKKALIEYLANKTKSVQLSGSLSDSRMLD